MQLTDEQKDKNKTIFFSKLNQIVGENNLESEIGDALLNATYSFNSVPQLVGDGTLLNTILRKLTPTALSINESLPESIRVDKNVIIKICLLSHIAKAIRIIPNDNEWEISKRGIFYKYDNSLPAIKTGLHSLILAQQAGINFTAEEAEAMTIADRDFSDEQARYYSSMLSNVIRIANELVYISETEINKKANETTTNE